MIDIQEPIQYLFRNSNSFLLTDVIQYVRYVILYPKQPQLSVAIISCYFCKICLGSCFGIPIHIHNDTYTNKYLIFITSHSLIYPIGIKYFNYLYCPCYWPILAPSGGLPILLELGSLRQCAGIVPGGQSCKMCSRHGAAAAALLGDRLEMCATLLGVNGYSPQEGTIDRAI